MRIVKTYNPINKKASVTLEGRSGNLLPKITVKVAGKEGATKEGAAFHLAVKAKRAELNARRRELTFGSVAFSKPAVNQSNEFDLETALENVTAISSAGVKFKGIKGLVIASNLCNRVNPGHHGRFTETKGERVAFLRAFDGFSVRPIRAMV